MAEADQDDAARRSRLDAAIAAARARLAAREGGADIGAVLAGVNADLDRITDTDLDEAERAMKKIEARLAAERIRREDDEEDADR